MSALHTHHIGAAGPRVAFLHGLFGQGRNWATVAKAISGPSGSAARCTLVDLPDHGRSPWTSAFSYDSYAAAVAQTLREIDSTPWIVVGHSLGGKTSMVLALTEPELVDQLVVVDIAPKGYGNLDRFRGYIAAMQALPLAQLSTRHDAEVRFAESDPAVKAFLLQNLRRVGDTWRWQANLELFAADTARGSASVVADFPIAPGERAAYDKPVLWVRGADSGYITDADSIVMRELFPKAVQVTVKGAGHWVHSDQPEVMIALLHRVLAHAR